MKNFKMIVGEKELGFGSLEEAGGYAKKRLEEINARFNEMQDEIKKLKKERKAIMTFLGIKPQKANSKDIFNKGKGEGT